MEDEFCECDEHGKQPLSFVCKHIIEVSRPKTVGFISYPREDDKDLRDAWCDECNEYLQSNGGQWIDNKIEAPAGIGILCAKCYLLKEADASHAGRRMIL